MAKRITEQELEALFKKHLNLTLKQTKSIMGKMTINQATIDIMNPYIGGVQYVLYSHHDTKEEALDRVKSLKKLHSLARVRKIPETSKIRKNIDNIRVFGKLSNLRKWGAYYSVSSLR